MQGGRMREYIEAKTYRDNLNATKGNLALELDDVSLDRKGKKRLVPVYLARHNLRRQEGKESDAKERGG
jgi:hypothetical protein